MKQAEFDASRLMSYSVRREICPLFDPGELSGLTDESDNPPETLRKRLVEKANQLVDNWGINVPFRVDLLFAGDEHYEGPNNPSRELLERLVYRGSMPIPVVGLSRPAQHNLTSAEVARVVGQGIAIRLGRDELLDPGTGVQILQFCKDHGVIPSEVDLLLDLNSVYGLNVSLIRETIADAIMSIPRLPEWRHVVLLSGGMPSALGSYEQDSLSDLERADLKLWLEVVLKTPRLRRIAYGDYGTIAPNPFFGVAYNVCAKLKYASRNKWLLAKGRPVNTHSFSQIHTLSKWIVESEDFLPPELSWGDKEIRKLAERNRRPGNFTNWVSYGLSRHIALTSAQTQLAIKNIPRLRVARDEAAFDAMQQAWRPLNDRRFTGM